MKPPGLDTPVAVFFFNRPDVTLRVLEAIRRARPSILLAIADGPRKASPSDAEAVAATRRLLDDLVNWDCRVLKNYAEENLGVVHRLASGLDWVFEEVEEAIILEDDTLPHPTFFTFCQELLDRYRDDTRIMNICGTNLYGGRSFGSASYLFSRYVIPPWGWASWRRAWNLYDVSLESFPDFAEQGQIRNTYRHRLQQLRNFRLYESIYRGGADSWDYQWQYAVVSNHGLAIHPSVNLVENLGLGIETATHTRTARMDARGNRAQAIGFPLIHPTFVTEDERAERHFYRRNILQRNVSFLVKRLFPAPVSNAIRSIYRMLGGRTAVGGG